MEHNLKIDERWLRRIQSNEKTAEVRRDDRDFQVGDTLWLYIEGGRWSAQRRRITHVLRDVPGLQPGYVVLSLEDPRVKELAEVRRDNERLERSNRSLRARARSLTKKLAGQ